MLVSDVDDDQGTEAVDRIWLDGGNAIYSRCEVSDPSQVQAMVACAVETLEPDPKVIAQYQHVVIRPVLPEMERMMAWTGIARQEVGRKGQRYFSDMTDRE